MMMTTTRPTNMAIQQPTTTRVVKVCASSKANNPTINPTSQKKHLFASNINMWGIPALVGAFAAAQITFLPPPASADLYTPMPSIDLVSDADALDVLSDIEDQKIPQLEVSLGALSSANKESPEVFAAAESQLESIEQEASYLAEEEATAPSSDAGNFAQETNYLIAQINALKATMGGMQ